LFVGAQLQSGRQDPGSARYRAPAGDATPKALSPGKRLTLDFDVGATPSVSLSVEVRK